jgi:hypothetical protein
MVESRTQTIDHDGLFKELIETFFWEFLELFLPQVLDYVEPDEVTFLRQEIYSSIGSEEKRIIDLLAQVKFRGQGSYFLFHLEPQASVQAEFERRMFCYFARLHEKYNLPIYPVVIFSYDSPRKAAESQYQVAFPDFQVLRFNFHTIQLNRLNWRDYLSRPNPVASALMAKMQIAKADRPKVKIECLRMLATLKLDPGRTEFIAKFVDTYLRLNQEEEHQFAEELGRLEGVEQETIMQTMTSWEEKGYRSGETDLVLRLLKRKVGPLSPRIEEQIQALEIEQVEALGEALLDFETIADLTIWLAHQDISPSR